MISSMLAMSLIITIVLILSYTIYITLLMYYIYGVMVLC